MEYSVSGGSFTPSEDSVLADMTLVAEEQMRREREELALSLDSPSNVRATAMFSRPTVSEPTCIDVPIEDLFMHNLAPEPTMQDFYDALTLTVEEWARRTIRASTNPELLKLLDADEQELAKIVLYANDISPYSRLVAGGLPSIWIWCATEWLSSSSLLQQLQQRMADYHPYVWDVGRCNLFAMTEAAAWDIHLTKHDRQVFLAKYNEVSTNDNEVTLPQHPDLRLPIDDSSAPASLTPQHNTNNEISTS